MDALAILKVMCEWECASLVRCGSGGTCAKAQIMEMAWSCVDKTLVNATEAESVIIITVVRVNKIRIIIATSRHQRILNTYRSCCCDCVRIYARPGRYIGMIILISIDVIVILRDHLTELVWVELLQLEEEVRCQQTIRSCLMTLSHPLQAQVFSYTRQASLQTRR